MPAHSTAEYIRAWRKANPDKVRTYNERYVAKLKADHVRYARYKARQAKRCRIYPIAHPSNRYTDEQKAERRVDRYAYSTMRDVEQRERDSVYGIDAKLFCMDFTDKRGGVPNDEF